VARTVHSITVYSGDSLLALASSPEEERACVLLAEDDFELRRLLIRALEKDGHRIIEIATGAELVHRLGRSLEATGADMSPDLIVMDIRMPGWSGLEVLEALHDVGSDIPVIIMTAFGDPETHEKAMRLGARFVLDKPLDPNDLRSLVLRILGPAPGKC
jgi:CheY-like chemotaxis protein